MRMPAKAKAMPRVQYAALPYRRLADGRTEVLLVTSRETRRWVIPKGWPIAGHKPHDSAAREALEEAGVIGKVEKEPIGRYCYLKRLKSGKSVQCEVDVFRLEVSRRKATFAEKHERKLRWFSPEEAAQAVEEDELRGLLQLIGKM